MRKMLTAATATLAVVVAPLAVAAPAQADTPRCVTKSEFRKVERGWQMKRVHRLFDAKGHLVFQSGAYRTREYRSCHTPRYDYISISYNHGRVYRKTAYWS